MIFPPVRVIQDRSRYLAQNGPFGVRITTGVHDFAAVMMQEIYEGRRYMVWYWLPAIAFAVLAALTRPEIAFLSVVWMLAVGRNWLPIGLDRRELMGQAIELAAIRLFYPPRDMDLEYRLQARSLLVTTNSYKRKGMFKGLPAVDPSEVRPGETNASIDRMIEWLKTLDREATAWLYGNRKTFERYYMMENEHG
jgi:hypothetical protein